MKNVILVLFVILVFGGAFALRDRAGTAPDTGDPPDSGVTMDQPLPTLIDLGSVKCVPCKKMAPILESLSEDFEGSFEVEFIDVWKDTEAGKSWGIRVIPTQIFLDATGEERFRHEGFLDRESILAKWAELGIEVKPVSARS